MSRYDPKVHHRRSIRLPGHDYSQGGAYYITLCTKHRRFLFGAIVDARMILNSAGQIVADEWVKTAAIRQGIGLDKWVVMPNHFHAIVVITPCLGRGDRPVAPTVVAPTPVASTKDVRPGARSNSLGALIAGFKSAVTKRINQTSGMSGAEVWQRNYYEHIIRNERDLTRVRQYIEDNPARWAEDSDNPQNILMSTVSQVAANHSSPVRKTRRLR
ncbi:MAG: transposase [Acidobacteriota bacterium]